MPGTLPVEKQGLPAEDLYPTSVALPSMEQTSSITFFALKQLWKKGRQSDKTFRLPNFDSSYNRET
jgi:hypothetical protein